MELICQKPPRCVTIYFVPVHINQTQYPQEFALHQKYAQSQRLLDLVWTHSNIINDIVIQLYQRQPQRFAFPLEIATQAALCHDVGAYVCGGFEWLPDQPPFQMPYAQHTIVGAWILYQEGYLPEVVQTAYFHAGVGLTAEDVSTHQLHLPVDNYTPTTDFQQLLTYAAKFHSKTPRFKTADEIRQSLQQFGSDKLTIFEQLVATFGEPDLTTIMPNYTEWHKAFAYEMTQLNSPQQAGFNSAGISSFPTTSQLRV